MRESDNWLMRDLPRTCRVRLLSRCRRVTLSFGQVLCNAGESSNFVYFPVAGFISLIAMVEDSPTLEMGLVGAEGMLGVQWALGLATNPFRALVQGAGKAWRLSAAAFRQELRLSAALRGVVDRYLFVTLAQTASSAACLRSHLLGPRLARWLLTTHDRAQVDTFYVTQDMLAAMLGVRRVGVTLAAGILQRQGLIRYSRGSITILDRPGMKRAACSCYAADRRAYARAMS